MDARKKKVVWILCVASLFLVWRAYGLFVKYALSEARAETTVVAVDLDGPPPEEPVPDSQDRMARVWEQQDSVAQQPWARDPFAIVPGAVVQPQLDLDGDRGSLQMSRPQAPAIAFTGVSGSDGQWLAVVRDGIVRIGDVIDGKYEVVVITNQSITLTAGAWAFRYELGFQEAAVRPLSEEQ